VCYLLAGGFTLLRVVWHRWNLRREDVP